MGVLGFIYNTEEIIDERIFKIMFRFSLNHNHCWELHVRGQSDIWYKFYAFPKYFCIQHYVNRVVIKWLFNNYDKSLRFLSLG